MPKKSKIKIRRSDELLGIDEELDRAVEHLDEVNQGVRDLLGTVEPETEEGEESQDEAVGETTPAAGEDPAAPATEDEPPASV